MGMFPNVFLLLALCIVLHDTFAMDAGEIEVALGPDGSVIDGDRPVETVARVSEEEADVAMQPRVETTADSMETRDAMNSQQQSDVVAVMATLQQELTAVQQMVQLQEKKLRVLEQMRGVWLQKYQEKEEKEEKEVGKRKGRADIGEVIGRRLDAAIAESVAESAAKDFNSHFVERAEIKLTGDVADMKMMKLRAASATELIAVAYRDGLVVFYSSDVVELLRVDTERRGIKSIALEAQDQLQPCLVVTYETPVVAIYELNIVEKGNTGGMSIETSSCRRRLQQ
ncbi:WD40-repeat-containing domain [Phytophthora cinnamomi]|uniref:WD40-repeat-containing domain n=1 Tax=Phytophthora cinnamomi TaxID=4785 RepID=UPI003559D549|nr:WD40-repeat-containing domain [Phytophthora cinnamomi]